MAFNIDPSKYTNRMLAGDIEANALYEQVTKLWCIISQDMETKEFFIFHDYPEYDNVEVFDPYDGVNYTIPERTGTFNEGVKFWYLAAHNGSKHIVHNCLAYDKPVLEKFYSKFKTPREAWIDTLVMSKVHWFDRTKVKGSKGAHGLEAYGIRFGVKKPAVNDWTEMDAFKLHRCIQDVEIQARTYEYLSKEKDHLLEKLGIDFSACIDIEYEYRDNATQQEIRGAMVDEDHIDWCIQDLDEKTQKLADEIEPLLPPTVKVKGKKLSRRDMAILFYGEKGERVPEVYEDKLKDGVMQKVPVKPYYQPSVNFHRTIKSNKYSGFHLSYGASPVRTKKKELTDWIKENYPDTKAKDWDIQKEEVEEYVLNKNTCEYFGIEETSDMIAGPYTRVDFEQSRMSQTEVVKGYLIKLGWKYAEEWNEKKDANGQKMRAEYDTEVRYPKKAAPENQLVKLVKKGQTLLTSPKLTDDDYDQLPEGVGKDIADYNSLMHRRRFLSNPKDPDNKGLKAYIRRQTGRIPCGVNNFNTSTGRSSQSVWVNAPGDGALYGNEIRQCITAPEGRKVVGIDMKSAQLSIAAYYAKNNTYYNAVASGEEYNQEGKYMGMSAHCFSSRLFGLVSDEDWKKAVDTQHEELLHTLSLKRKYSKGASFGVIFGCSGKKLAVMLGIPENEGNEKKNLFLEQMGLQGVQQWLLGCKRKYGRAGGYYIPLPMGYWVWCKMDHKAINYLIQGTEAVCQKLAVNYFEQKAKELELDAIKIIDYHDEMLVEASEEDADAAGKLACEAYEYASRAVYEWHLENPDLFPNQGKPEFMFNLDGGYQVGQNYGQVH